MDTHILVIKLVPGFSDEAIMAIINHSKTVRAIIFEMYGTGNAPSTRAGLLDAVRTATGRGIVVVALTQCRQVLTRVTSRPHTHAIPIYTASPGDLCLTRLALLAVQPQGGVLLSKYEVGQALQSAGIVSGGDMTTEAAATKLAYLFGRLGDSAKVKEVIGVNLRGELSPTEKVRKEGEGLAAVGHQSGYVLRVRFRRPARLVTFRAKHGRSSCFGGACSCATS